MVEPQLLQLEDGHALAYADYGPPDGRPVIYCHGGTGSHLLPPAEVDLARQAGLRLIVPARPGISLSTFQPNRTLLDWPDDVEALADALSVDRFGVIGVSRGGVYAATCASKIPHRLNNVTIASGPAPFGAFETAEKPPTMSEMEADSKAYLQQVRENPDATFDEGMAELPEAERQAARAFFTATVLEAFRQGVEGDVYDWLLCYTQPWGFALEDIEAEVHIWHGDADPVIPLKAARYLAEHIPNCTLRVLPEVGHLVPLEYWRDIFGLM